jgi:large subunit ribosomal protein L4
MSKIKVYNQKGENVGEVTRPTCFDIKVDEKIISRYVQYLQLKAREAIANTKDRSQVSGGGRKPWKQKGTGNARHGSSRSPIWVGGGVTFGPSKDNSYATRMNTKERKKALIMTLASKSKDILVVDKISLKEPKTKKALEVLNKLPVMEGRLMIFMDDQEGINTMSLRNLPFVTLSSVKSLNALDILKVNQLVFEQTELESLSKIYTDVK